MSSALHAKALKIRLPNDNGRTANDFGVLKIAVTTSHGQSPLPAEYAGRFVVMLFVATSGDTCHFGFSQTTGREVDTSVSATTAGASAKVGWPAQHGIEIHRFVPDYDVNVTGYLIHEGSAAGTLYLALADG